MRTACPALRRDECFCGRKNYRLQDIQLSKNVVEAISCQLSASSCLSARLRAFGARRGELLSILFDSRPGQQVPRRRTVRVSELVILRSALTPMQARPKTLLRNRRRSTPSVRLRASARQPSRNRYWPAWPKPALPGFVSSGQASAGRRLENTGLEPVTSWLQTRRSPS